MSNAKYFGVTLDRTLIKFDLYQLKKKTAGIIIPTFFKPSILLNKLLRQAPLKTKENYLRAFISTISTPAIEENNFTSKIAIRSLKYFHKMGIDNEKLILDCLKDELFLKNFEKKETDENELEEFVESEINKQINLKTQKIEELELSVEEREKRLSKVTEYNSLTKKDNEILIEKSEELKKTVDLYNRELIKLKRKTNEIKEKSNGLQLNIYNEAEHLKADKEAKRKDLLSEKLFDTLKTERLRWRFVNGLFHGLVAIILLFLLILIYAWQNSSWNIMSYFMDYINGMDEARKNITYIIITIIIGVLEYLIVKKAVVLIFSKKAKKVYVKELRDEFYNN